MKEGIHPDYKKAIVTCVCGNTFETRSTVGNLKIEICSACHPFFTGRQKLVDSAGRVERYNKKYAKKTRRDSGRIPVRGPPLSRSRHTDDVKFRGTSRGTLLFRTAMTERLPADISPQERRRASTADPAAPPSRSSTASNGPIPISTRCSTRNYAPEI